MAEDKKGFILYADQKELFDQLPDDKAGQLIKHIFKYVNDENPIAEDLLIKIAFTPIKRQFKRDLEKWEETRVGRSKAGKASAEARKLKKEQEATKSTSVKFVEKKVTNPTVSVNGNVSVNVNVNDIKNNIEFDIFWNLYDKKAGDKVACKKKWDSLTDKERQQSIDTLPTFLSSIREKQFQPLPATYLNQKRWNDEISINQTPTLGRTKTGMVY